MPTVYILFRESENKKIIDCIDGQLCGDVPKELVDVFASEASAEQAKRKYEKQSRDNVKKLGCDPECFSIKPHQVQP